MKWLGYVGWFAIWFLLHSFIFVPIINGTDVGFEKGLAAAVNFTLLFGGFWMVHKRFKETE